MEYVIAICLGIIIYLLFGIRKHNFNTYNSNAIINNNLRVIRVGLDLLLEDKDKDTYHEISENFDKESQGFVDIILKS
jgi:hypothetical protein